MKYFTMKLKYLATYNVYIIMNPRYHKREKGHRLESVDYKIAKKKDVFPTPSPPYNGSSSRSRSRTRSRTKRKRHKEYRKKEVFPAPSPPHNELSKSNSKKKTEKLKKLRNAHGTNQINYLNFWQ